MGMFQWFFGWLFGSDPIREQYKQERRELKDELKRDRVARKIAKRKLKEAKLNYRAKQSAARIRQLTEERQRLLDALNATASARTREQVAEQIQSLLDEIAREEAKKAGFDEQLAAEARDVQSLDEKELKLLGDEAEAEVRINAGLQKEKVAGPIDRDVHGGSSAGSIEQEITVAKRGEAAQQDLIRVARAEESNIENSLKGTRAGQRRLQDEVIIEQGEQNSGR